MKISITTNETVEVVYLADINSLDEIPTILKAVVAGSIPKAPEQPKPAVSVVINKLSFNTPNLPESPTNVDFSTLFGGDGGLSDAEKALLAAFNKQQTSTLEKNKSIDASMLDLVQNGKFEVPNLVK